MGGKAGGPGQGPKYHFWVDGVEYVHDDEHMTAAHIKEVAGIPAEMPLLLLNQDGTELQLGDEDVIDLKPGRRFARAPRFKRG